MKSFMRIILGLILLVKVSFGQPTPTDPLNIANGENLEMIHSLALSNWKKVWGLIDKEKAKFFYLDDNISFVDYLDGCYDDPRDKVMAGEARRDAEEILRFRDSYDGEIHRQWLLNLFSFRTIRYCPVEMREELWEAWLELKD